MKVKQKDLRKRLPQLPINYPGPDVVPFDYEAEKARVENLCKRLADNEVEVRDAVLAEIPRFLKEICLPFVSGEHAAAAAAIEAATDLEHYDAGSKLWSELLQIEAFANLELVFEKLCLGLYFCMWHSDKPLVQLECAQTMAALLHAAPTMLLRELFLRTLLRTLSAQWRTVDKWRMDKYMAWVRRICYAALEHLVTATAAPSTPVVAKEDEATVDLTPARGKRKGTSSTMPSAGKTPSRSSKSKGSGTVPVEEGRKSVSSPSRKASSAAPPPQHHPSVRRVCSAFQQEVVRGTSVGLTMHICDLMLTEMLKCPNLEPALFVAVAEGVPLYAMQRGDYVEKRVMDNFVVPIGAGQLEQRSEEFSLVTATRLIATFEALSVSRATHFSVRPMMVEGQKILENYVGMLTEPDLYEPMTKRDEGRRIAEEVKAAEEIKLRMSRIAQKTAAAHGAVRAFRRSTKAPAQPTSKRNARWKKR